VIPEGSYPNPKVNTKGKSVVQMEYSHPFQGSFEEFCEHYRRAGFESLLDQTLNVVNSLIEVIRYRMPDPFQGIARRVGALSIENIHVEASSDSNEVIVCDCVTDEWLVGNRWEVYRISADEFTLKFLDLERVRRDLETGYEHDRSYLDWLDALDLLRIGYFREAVIIAHTALDAYIVRFLEERLREQTSLPGEEAKILLNSIKERRLKTYFGVYLRLVTDRSLQEDRDLWARLQELNRIRNNAVHLGHRVNRSDAKRHVESARLILAFLKGLEREIIQKHLDDRAKDYRVSRDGVLLPRGFKVQITGAFEPIRDYFEAKVLVPDSPNVVGLGFGVAGHTKSSSSILAPAVERLRELGFKVELHDSRAESS